jgi:hypothetical protein
MFIKFPLVPYCTHILCPKFNSLWPSSKAEDYNISILGCPKLGFFLVMGPYFCVLSMFPVCPCMFPIMFLNFPMCSPEHHTFIPHSLPQSSPFSPSRLYSGAKEKALYFHTQTSILGSLQKVRLFLYKC